MSEFEAALEYVLEKEGLLEKNNKSDPGGITKYGISLRFLKNIEPEKLKKYGFPQSENICAEVIQDLTLDKAKELYKGEFWSLAPFNKINNQNICNYIFDAVVNMGISPAIKCIQRAIWSVAKYKNIIPEDGILGEKTISYINQCGAFLLLPAFRSERGGEYRLIAQANPNERHNLEGWLTRAYGEK